MSIETPLTNAFEGTIMKLPMKYPKLLSPTEVAKILRISRRTIYRLIERKEIRAVKVSRDLYRITEKDLNNFIKKHKTS